MSIKLIAIDIDGTLLNSQKQVTDEVKNALKAAEAQGVKIVLCTGRPLPGVEDLLEELDLLGENDFVITYNGSLVQKTKNKEIISSYQLTYDDYLDIDQLSRKLKVHLYSETEDTMYTSNRDISKYIIFETALINMPLKYRTQEEITSDLNIIKMIMIDEPDFLDEIIPKIPQSFWDNYTIVKSLPHFLEFMHKEVHKGVALERLAKHLGLQREEIMAIGDNENDLTMVDYAGLGVAMENATENIKKAADVITASNDENGVAEAINKYVLN